MKTLKAFKNNIGTILIDENNEVVSYYPINLSQPHRNSKKIVHNCFTYQLEWLKAETKELKHWLNQTILAVSKKLYATYFNSKTPISKESQEKMKKDTENLPLIISFMNDYQFKVKLKTKWVH